MKPIIIDANGAVFGRVCSLAAKKALAGNEVIVINSEKAVITGNKHDIVGKYMAIRKKGGHSRKGPRYSMIPYKILKWGIRGMLPNHRWGQGKAAFARIKCYNGVPQLAKGHETVSITTAKKIKSIPVGELSQKI